MYDLEDLEDQLASLQEDIVLCEDSQERRFLKVEEQYLLGLMNHERKNGLQLHSTEEDRDNQR